MRCRSSCGKSEGRAAVVTGDCSGAGGDDRIAARSFSSPSKCTASLAFKKTRISSRLIPGLLLTLIVNPQHDRSPLQAHLVRETASPSRLILHEIRLFARRL